MDIEYQLQDIRFQWEEGRADALHRPPGQKGRPRHFPAQRRGGNQVRRREVHRRAAGGDLVLVRDIA